MGLQEYRRKRDFKKTSEPPPGKVKAHAHLNYLIQKHDATRLHYDFRLELDGVLLSWAVTRGPSLNPADKRLAVRTEDHPISYGTFEGTIPKGEYGGGTVMLWDEGYWEPKGDPRAGLKKGHISFTLHGKRLKGDWALIRMRGDDKRENWLLVKEKDEVAVSDGTETDFLNQNAISITTGRTMDEIAVGKRASGKKKSTHTESGTQNMASLIKRYSGVQLATLVDHPPEGKEWVHEVKFDGYRLLGFLSNGEVRLYTRNGLDWTHKFPALTHSLNKLKADNAVLDMEAVVLNADGKSSFQGLQAALSEGHTEKIVAYAFDLLALNNQDLTALKLLERKERLQTLLKKPQSIFYSEHVAGHGEDMIARACHLGLEGIVSKIADAPYQPGRQKSWLKSKCSLRQEFIILGLSKARKGGRSLGALYLGYNKDGKLRYAGKVGTGFTMKSAAEISGKLRKRQVETPTLSQSDMPDVPAQEFKIIQWVEPALLCEVAFTEWTKDGHIRHPSFQGLREDKKASDVKMEKARPVGQVKKTVKAKMAKEKESGADLILDGIKITHPDRVISETGHVTKGELAEYYAAIAPLLLPGLVNRPLSLLRCPTGIDGECFFQRNPGRGLGPDVKTFHFSHKGKKYEYLYIEDKKGLMEIIQMGSIELHPWGATVKKIDYPDRMIFDLDPAPDIPFEAVKLAAMDLRERLKGKGLESFVKTTGGKGLHVTVPLSGKDKWPDVKKFAETLSDEMVADAPEAYIATMTKSKRNGKIFIDFFRNDYTATAVADYGVRARPGAPVALPLEWKDLKNLKAGNQFSMAEVLKRIKKIKPNPDRYKIKQSLP
jgi:bifunctional non-homologous end joining protein LigD